MKHVIEGPMSENARNFMRRAGYGETRGMGGQVSYQKRLRYDKYPRFHAYVEEQGSGMVINLHMDQKAGSIGAGHAHGGEYEGELVEKEMARLAAMGLQSAGGKEAPAKKYYDNDLPTV